MLRVAEFARLAGVTVRTLQYYDRIGLLKPSATSEAGYRLYRARDLLRLQQIVTLKHLGFPLKEISTLLDSPGGDLQSSLRNQQRAIQTKISQLHKIADALEQAGDKLATVEADDLDPGLLIEIIRSITEAEKWRGVEDYYSPEQRSRLAEQRDALGPQALAQAQNDWSLLMAEFQSCRSAGLKVDDPGVRPLAERMHKLIEAFTQGDAGIHASLNNYYRDQAKRPAEEQPFDTELSSYMQKALQSWQQSTADSN